MKARTIDKVMPETEIQCGFRSFHNMKANYLTSSNWLVRKADHHCRSKRRGRGNYEHYVTGPFHRRSSVTFFAFLRRSDFMLTAAQTADVAS